MSKIYRKIIFKQDFFYRLYYLNVNSTIYFEICCRYDLCKYLILRLQLEFLKLMPLVQFLAFIYLIFNRYSCSELL